MANEKQATVAVELESTKSALQAARKELDSARDRESKLLDTLKSQAKHLESKSEGKSAVLQYAELLLLLTVLGMAGWLVYITLQLQVLLT